MMDVSQVTIIGTGLLGASVGLGLKGVGYRGEIVGLGRRPRTLEAARARGAVDRITTDPCEALEADSLAVVAVPLGAFGEMFDWIASTGRPLIVTDVGSTKAGVLREARQRLAPGQSFVGSHPMAGSERQGPEAADADLCRGKPCVLTVEPDTPERAVAVVRSLWQTLGMRLLTMSADEHDLQVAAISHLPHLASVMLVRVAEQFGGWEIASTGFRDTTRLASSNPPMRLDILEANRAHVVATLNALAAVLDEVRIKVELGQRDALLAMLQATKDRRDAWIAEGVPSPRGGESEPAEQPAE
jgi:prephenate dehydrogenase